MCPHLFNYAGYYVKEDTLLRAPVIVTLEEGVPIALYGVSHDLTQKVLGERFQHSIETIHRHVRRLCQSLFRLAPIALRHRNTDTTHPRIRNNRRFYP